MNNTEKQNIKVIGTASEMSNLVGMYAFFVVDKKIITRIYIKGKADNKHFICQLISPLDGNPNIAMLLTVKQLTEWVIIPDRETADYILDDYSRNGWRFGNPYLKGKKKVGYSDVVKKLNDTSEEIHHIDIEKYRIKL